MTLTTVFPMIFALLLSLGGNPIPDDEPQPVALGGTQAAFLTFEADTGEAVTITVQRADDDDPLNDPVVALIAPEGLLLAYNNQHGSDNPDLAPQDAQINAFILPDAGTYTIYVNTYGGIYAGTLTVTLERVDPFQAEIDTNNDVTMITASLPEGTPYRYTFSAQAGQTVTLTARDRSGTLDPVLRLFDVDGVLLAFNDDHPGADLTLDAFDAQILAFTIPSDGDYTVQVSDFLGRTGDVALVIERSIP